MTRYTPLVVLVALLAFAVACASSENTRSDDPKPSTKAEETPKEDKEVTGRPTKLDADGDKVKVKAADDVFGGAVKIDDNENAFAVEASSVEVKPKAVKIEVKAETPAERNELVIGTPIVKGELERSEVENRVQRQQKALDACFEERINSKGAGGSLILSFDVKPAGTLEKVKIAKSTINDKKIEDCVTGVIGKIVLPVRKKAENASVQLPLLLTAPN